MEDDINDTTNTRNGFEETPVPVHSSCSKDKVKTEVLKTEEHAGPSKFHALPGTVTTHTSSNPIKAGVSISEYQPKHIITAKDLSNALKMTSVSFNNNDQSINFKLTNTDLDLTKIMESCLKMKTEGLKTNHKMNLHTVPTIKIEEDILDSTNTPLSGSVRTETAPISILKFSRPVVRQNSLECNRKKSSRSPSELSGFMSNKQDSLSSMGSNVCRICMTRGRERLISPCHCKGSLASVHLSCLERWLNQVGRNHCELCGFSYPAIRTPRYTILQALRLWFGNPRNRSHLQSDCLIFWLLSTVTAGLLAVCIVGTQYFVLEGNRGGKRHAGGTKEEGVSHRITETAMDFFMAIVLCGYSVTVYLLWKDHYVMWNRWRRSNVNVRLLITPDANPVPFVPRPPYNVV